MQVIGVAYPVSIKSTITFVDLVEYNRSYDSANLNTADDR